MAHPTSAAFVFVLAEIPAIAVFGLGQSSHGRGVRSAIAVARQRHEGRANLLSLARTCLYAELWGCRNNSGACDSMEWMAG